AMLKAIAAGFRVFAAGARSRVRLRSAAASWPVGEGASSLDVVARRMRRALRGLAVLVIVLATFGLATALSSVPAAAPTPLAPAAGFATPQYYPAVQGDSFYNTVGADGDILFTSDDSRGVDRSCTPGGADIGIFRASGADPAHLRFSTVNCMESFG